MGYYTYYILTMDPNKPEIWEDIKMHHPRMYYAVGLDDDCRQDCKWYDHEEDMVEFSKKFPDVTFKLYGEGGERDDIWDKYFRNGKKQLCPAEIIIPSINEENWE